MIPSHLVVALGCRPHLLGRQLSKWGATWRLQRSCGLPSVNDRNNGTEHAGTMKNSLRQTCDRQGFECLQALEVCPASDILPAVNNNVEPHVRSLCGSSDHLCQDTEDEAYDTKAPVVTVDGPCRKPSLWRRGSHG